MRRMLITFAAIGIATVALLGPGRSLLPGSLRLQVPDAAPTAGEAQAHPTHETSAAPAARPEIVPPPDGARVGVVTRSATKVEQGYVVEARVVTPDSKPVNDAIVRGVWVLI
jgi:hypothetical protein